MPTALLATAYMATSAQKDALDAHESPPLPGPWTLMTVSVPPAVTTSRAWPYPAQCPPRLEPPPQQTRPLERAIKRPPRTAAADAAWASTPKKEWYPW